MSRNREDSQLGFPALLRECNMTTIVAVVLALVLGLLISSFGSDDRRNDVNHFDEHYRNLSHYDDE
jgi:hypothetical protein